MKHLIAVVLMELRAGAISTKDRRLLQQVETVIQRAGRILTPSPRVFADAGETLRRLQRRGFPLDVRGSFVNDVLIALSARSIGAIVVTQNERHYRAIQSVTSFRLMVAAEGNVPPAASGSKMAP